MYSWKTRRC